jgi:hypothetical protein
MTAAQRATVLRLCAALYGLGVAISMVWFWLQPAPPGQPPGYMTSLGYDASACFRFVASLIILPILSTLLWGPLLDRLAQDDTQPWARNTAAISLIATMWTALLTKAVLWAIVPAAIGVIGAYATRHLRAGFSRRDIILIPTVATVWMALLDLTLLPFDQAFLLAAMLVVAVRIAIVGLQPGRGLDAALSFSIAPLALITQTHFLARDQRHFGWTPLAIALLSPMAMRLLVDETPRTHERLRKALAWVIYPIVCYAYLSAASLLSAEGKPRADIFEDSQHLVPAAEMTRGEHAYHDIVPPHGFIQDGLLDYLFMRSGDATIGQLLRARRTISAFSSIAVYAVGVAATGSAEAGLLTFFLAMSTGIGTVDFRFVPVQIALALILQAVRTRRPRLLAVAAAVVVATFLTSIEFGVYAGVALLVAAARFHGARLRALLEAAAGGAITAALVAIGMGLAGILTDFFRVTFGEVARLGPVYALSIFEPPYGFQQNRAIPEVLYTILEPSSRLYMIWVAAMIFFVVAITTRRTPQSPHRRTRMETLIVLSSFIVVAAISYAERHHLYFELAVPALLVATVIAMRRARIPMVRLIAPAMVIVVLIIARPTFHIAVTAGLRHSRLPIDLDWREIGEIPRARGALFRSREKVTIQTANRYFSTHLKPGDTFFDFTNRGLLYYLFDRDCPVRQIEVAFYESEPLQREVIARIERNPRVKIAIVPFDEDTGIDGVGSRLRAPLVWRYLQQRFTFDHMENDLIFWRRK